MTELPDTNFIHVDMMRLICGEYLGSGIGRQVYVCAINPKLVIKFESTSHSFQNVKEWEVWQAVSEVEHVKRWFAPCEMISPCGAVLIQRRTTECYNFPERMPAFLCDFKSENYGILDGRLVCHDYGMHLMLENGMTKRMRKADWWSQKDESSG